MTASQTDLAWDAFLDLGEPQDGPLHARLSAAIRDAIRDGTLPPGSALPPSRQLAADLGCSRWVVTESYGQLVAEGYLEARSGAATRVNPAAYAAEQRRQATAALARPAPPRFHLAPGLPDLREFPRNRWMRAMRAVLTDAPFSDLGNPEPAGHPRLREVVAAYLKRVRAANTGPDAVTITHSASDAITRLTRSLRRQGRGRIAVEDPGWTRLREGIIAEADEVIGIPVDDEGIRVDLLAEHEIDAVVVAPAHQFPTGVVLSPDRRAALLSWAERSDAYVIEDDYDAEYRYDRQPVSTLQGMAPNRVALTGSVSKTLSPALGIGWVAAPEPLLASMRTAVAGVPPVMDQLALAELIDGGGYDRHLRAARQRYRARRDAVLEALARELPRARPSGAAAGLHLLLRLPDGVLASDVVRHAAENGLHVVDLLRYRMAPADDDTLVIGYANLPDSAVTAAVGTLAKAVHAAMEDGDVGGVAG